MKYTTSLRRNHPIEEDKDVRTKRVTAANRPKELFENDHKSKSQDASTKKLESSGRSLKKGGSVTIDQIDDPLRVVKIAMENKVAMKESLLERLATHLCVIEESANL